MHVCSECGQGYERAGYCAADGHPLADAQDPVLGTEVLRYRIARLIGRGGMGNVYLGVQPQIGSRVAVKILSQECAREPELVERFFAEARAVNLIRHENIVSVIDMAKLPDGRPFIVMEFIEGATLSRVIKGGRAPLGGIVQVFSDVLSALAAAHAIGIIHRDLKPDNIIVTAKGHAKVLDFGIAKLAPALRAVDASPRTQTGALLGTPAYMAPEQISGAGGVDGRSDVYGAGVVLFEAVTGQVPFAGATLFDMMRAQLEDAPPSPRALRADLPASMEAVILTALAKKPAERFQSAAAMANALEQASMELPHDQWRELSTRSAPLTRGSAPRVRPMTTAPPPMTMHRDTPPAMSAVNVPRTNEKTVVRRSRRPLVLALMGMAVAGGVGAIIAVAATRSEPAAAPAPAPAPIAQVAPMPADAALPADAAIERLAVVEIDAAAPAKPKQMRSHDERRPIVVAQSESKRAPAPPPPPQAAPADQTSGTPAGAPKTRAEIAEDFKMHPDHVALPGEIPIKRKPRMSRGKYSATNFDWKAFLPQALKLARAEAADAKLIDLDIVGVAPDGRANIAREYHGVEYRFVTQQVFEEGCYVVVAVLPNKIETYFDSPVVCGPPVAMPHCTLAQVWEKARALGTKADSAHISYNRNGWIFGADITQSISDECP